jgi:hypothetical protein
VEETRSKSQEKEATRGKAQEKEETRFKGQDTRKPRKIQTDFTSAGEQEFSIIK